MFDRTGVTPPTKLKFRSGQKAQLIETSGVKT